VLGERGFVITALLLLGAGFAAVGTHSTVWSLALGILCTAIGTAILKPALISALSMTAPPELQGAMMGKAQSLGSLINIFAPLVGSVLMENSSMAGGLSLARTTRPAANCLKLLLLPSHAHLSGRQVCGHPAQPCGNL
jgi:MFS family permease